MGKIIISTDTHGRTEAHIYVFVVSRKKWFLFISFTEYLREDKARWIKNIDKAWKTQNYQEASNLVALKPWDCTIDKVAYPVGLLPKTGE